MFGRHSNSDGSFCFRDSCVDDTAKRRRSVGLAGVSSRLRNDTGRPSVQRCRIARNDSNDSAGAGQSCGSLLGAGSREAACRARARPHARRELVSSRQVRQYAGCGRRERGRRSGVARDHDSWIGSRRTVLQAHRRVRVLGCAVFAWFRRRLHWWNCRASPSTNR